MSFNAAHPDVNKKYEQIGGSGRPNLSQMSNISTSKLTLYLGAEVKIYGGDEVEAKGQLFTWLGTGIIKTRQLLIKMDKVTKDYTQPLIGWTIVGHEWKLYITVGMGNEWQDEIGIYGPIKACNVDTSGYLGVFKLLRLTERIKLWARETYWP